MNTLNLGCNATILDAGCGTVINLTYLRDYGNVVGLDISEIAIGFCRKRGCDNATKGDAEKLPFKDNKFDLITALDLIEHLDDHKALNEFRRVLKPNDYLIVTVPAFNFLWSKHDEAVNHKRRYNQNQFRVTLESCGFTVERLSYWNFFMFFPIVAVRLLRRHVMKERATKSDVEELPGPINLLLVMVLMIECALITHINLPFGVSLICVARAAK